MTNLHRRRLMSAAAAPLLSALPSLAWAQTFPARPVRVVSVSTTAMDSAYPRRSTSERLLEIRLKKRARC